MYSSNSFNVCPHCGKANSLNARYCSACGKQLAVPEEVVVCHKCHRPNSSMASFCGSCGAPLRVGAQTKICPKCHKEVNVNANVCSCGYSFSGVRYANPESTAVDKKAERKAAKLSARNSVTADPRHKGARGIAVFTLVILLLFAYLIMMPAFGRPGFLSSFDKGIFNKGEGEGMNLLYGYDMVYQPIKAFLGEDGGFHNVLDNFGIGGLVWAAVCLILGLTMIIQLVAMIIRLISGKRHKGANLFHLIMAIITTLFVALLWIFKLINGEGFVVTMRHFFLPTLTVTGPEEQQVVLEFGLGYLIYLIPLYYWLCFLFSVAFKQKKVKEQAA